MIKFRLRVFFRETNYRHYICAFLTLCTILISVFCFPYAIPRLVESFRDVGTSFGFFFCESFGKKGLVYPTVLNYSKMPFTMPDFLPETWEIFVDKWNLYWQKIGEVESIYSYLIYLRKSSLLLSFFLMFGIPIIALFTCVIISLIRKKNTDYGYDTLPLKIFKQVSKRVYLPVKKWLFEFRLFLFEHKYYLYTWLLIWLLNFNIFTIIISILAYYYYFCSTLDVASLYTQVIKLFCDLSVMLDFVPVPLWIIFAWIIFVKIRKALGLNMLNHHERRNRGFVGERGICLLFVAPMRQGKTKFMVSFALSQSIKFRDDAYSIICESDLKFPYFPWINFENSIKDAMKNHSIYNLYTCRRFVQSKMMKFFKRPCRQYIFGYDFKRYGIEFDNGKTIENIVEVLSDYAQAYFIYIINTFIVSNFSIRQDDFLKDIGNFPKRESNFFTVKSRDVPARSRYSKIINYDTMRLCQQVVGESAFAFEFGIFVFTEWAKERLNQTDLIEMKKSDTETNQRNDGVDLFVKMMGHNATVAYRPFVSLLGDDQREQNLGAGFREVGEIIRVEKNDKGKLALPGFFLEEILYAISSKINNILHLEKRYNQGNNTLIYHILHTITSKIDNYYTRIYNTYGYELMKVSVQDGAQNEEKKMHKWYISNKKDLSMRYATDCLSELLTVRSARATQGLNDIPSYLSVKATLSELMKQNSYFISDMTKVLVKKEKKKSSKAPIKKENSAPEKWMQFVNAKK